MTTAVDFSHYDLSDMEALQSRLNRYVTAAELDFCPFGTHVILGNAGKLGARRLLETPGNHGTFQNSVAQLRNLGKIGTFTAIKNGKSRAEGLISLKIHPDAPVKVQFTNIPVENLPWTGVRVHSHVLSPLETIR